MQAEKVTAPGIPNFAQGVCHNITRRKKTHKMNLICILLLCNEWFLKQKGLGLPYSGPSGAGWCILLGYRYTSHCTTY